MKKIISLLILSFFVITSIIPVTHAITFGGTNTHSIPAVITREDWKAIWSFNNDHKSNGFVSMVCAGGKSGNDCSTYLGQLATFFTFDRTDPKPSYVAYKIAGKLLQFRMYLDNNYPEYIFFDYVSRNDFSSSNFISSWPIAKVPKDKSCGTEEDKICVVWLNAYVYFVSAPSISWVYIPFIDMLKYSNDNNGVVFTRKYYDGTSGNWHRTVFDSLLSFFNQYKGSYGQFVIPFYYDTNIYYLRYPWTSDDQYFYIRYHKPTASSSAKFTAYTWWTSYEWRYWGLESPSRNSHGNKNLVFYGTYASYDAYTSMSQDNTWFRDFLVWWENASKLIYNLKDFFGVSDVSSAVAGTGASSNPENWNDDTTLWLFNCELLEVTCHIRNVEKTLKWVIKWWVAWVNWFIKTVLWEIAFGFWDLVKDFYSWFSETEFYKNYVKQIIDYLLSFFEVLFKLVTFQYNWDDIRWGNQEYICSKNLTFLDESSTAPGKKPIESLWALIYLLSPYPPDEWQFICTSLWLKEIHYNESTFVDLLLFNIFIFASVWFGFIWLRKYP